MSFQLCYTFVCIFYLVFFLVCPSLDCELQEAKKFDTNRSLPGTGSSFSRYSKKETEGEKESKKGLGG